jgi:hypothetical protein
MYAGRMTAPGPARTFRPRGNVNYSLMRCFAAAAAAAAVAAGRMTAP